MSFFLQLVLSGTAVGAIYGLVAVGYSITYTTVRVLNFSQGQFVMLGAMVGLTLHVWWGWHLIPTLLVSIVVLAVFTAGVERISVRPFLGAESMSWVLSTLAVGIMVENAAQLVWGREALPFPPAVGGEPIRWLGIGIYPQEVLILGASFLLMAVLDGFYRWTTTGKALRATAYDLDVASLMGINVSLMVSMSFAISSGLAAIAGILVAPVTLAEATMGNILGLKAFAVAIIGGLDSPRGIFISALAYGMFEALCAGYIYPGIRDALGFLLVILVLLIRPSGLFGRVQIEKV
ncbi:MAG TPA: branched-chain amino acid ABC transporter permease [Candidatus Binatia bacterium]|nr:branched-chain amino acid ABC transporter permease [Candidatus Binatia bacterium]